MIVLTLLPFETQCVKAVKRKNKIKVINTFEDFDSIVDALKENDIESVINVLREVINFTKGKREEFYFVLPDTFFQISSEHYEDYRVENQSSYMDFLRSNDIDVAGSYFSLPAQMKTADEWYKTYFVIDKNIIDVLIQATKQLNIVVKAIEPASISIMRYLNIWQTQTYILTISREATDVVFYTPLVGFFKFQLDLSGEELKNADTREIQDALEKALNKVDIYFYQKLNGYVNPSGNIYIIAPEALKQKILRINEKKYVVVNSVNNSAYVENDDNYFAIGIGSFLQLINDENFYQLPPCFYMENANILPNNLLNQNNIIQTKMIVQKQSKLIAAGLITLIAFQIGAIAHFSSITIPDKIKNDFEIANAKIKSLETEEKTISTAAAENENPMEILSNLLQVKPQNDDLGFTELTVMASEAKKNNDWIKINLISDDSLKIREYVTRLQDNPMFGPINVNEINNNANGAKTAEITINKPNVTKSKDAKNKSKDEKSKDQEVTK